MVSQCLHFGVSLQNGDIKTIPLWEIFTFFAKKCLFLWRDRKANDRVGKKEDVMKNLTTEEMSCNNGGGAAFSCIVGVSTIIGGLIGTALCPPAGVLAGAIWTGIFVGDVTNTTLSCAEWISGE